MLYPSPTTDRIYIAFEHDDVKIFDPATRGYQDLNIQKINQLTILINSFLEKEKDELWIGTDSGLFIYKIDTGECTRIRQDPLDPYALSSHFISAFCRDRENGIWICFHQNGLNYYSPFRPFHVHYPWDGQHSMKGEVTAISVPTHTAIYGSGRKMPASTAWKRKPEHSPTTSRFRVKTDCRTPISGAWQLQATGSGSDTSSTAST